MGQVKKFYRLYEKRGGGGGGYYYGDSGQQVMKQGTPQFNVISEKTRPIDLLIFLGKS